jgi:hypothetical protein
MLAWVNTAGHSPGPWELYLLVAALSWAAFASALIWTLYVAIEPYVRRNWPDALISWTRLLNGRFRDPLVGSHILAAIPFALFWELEQQAGFLLGNFFPDWWSLPEHPPIQALNSARFLFGIAAVRSSLGAYFGAAFILLVVFLRLLFRRTWLADLVWALLFGLVCSNALPWAFLIWFTSAYVWIWLLRRFGMLAFLTTLMIVVFRFAMPSAITSWYASWTLACHLAIAALAAWALHATLAPHERRDLPQSSASR